MAFLKILVGSIVFVFFVWGSLILYGKMQSFIPYDHPIMKIEFPWVMAYGGDSAHYPSHTKLAFDSAIVKPQVWLAVDVFLSAENHFYAIPANFVNPTQKPWSSLTDAEIENIDAGQQSLNPIQKLLNTIQTSQETKLHFYKLEDLLALYPQTHFLLWFRDNVRDLDLIISSALKRIPNIENRIIINSEYDVVLRSLKEQLPRWVYGCGVGEKTRFLMMDSLQLIAVTSLKGDFYLSSLKQGKVNLVNPELHAELKRRYLPFILGPLETEKDVNDALRLSPEGYLTTDPKFILQMFDERVLTR